MKRKAIPGAITRLADAVRIDPDLEKEEVDELSGLAVEVVGSILYAIVLSLDGIHKELRRFNDREEEE